MDELTRKALVETLENIIEDFEERQLSETDIEGLNYEQLKCISECLQFGQFKNRLKETFIKIEKKSFKVDDGCTEIDCVPLVEIEDMLLR